MPAEAVPRRFPDRARRPRGMGNIRRPRIGALFWWTILIIVLGIAAVLSWFLSIYIFNHPDEPLPYRILTKLEKLEPPLAFAADNPPNGDFQKLRTLYETSYQGFAQHHLDFINAGLLRDYIENFRRSESKLKEDRITYVRGEFTVDFVRALTDADLIRTGLVVRASSPEFPNASIELILPTRGAPPVDLLEPGASLTLNRPDYATLVHVTRPDERSMCFGLIPITYGEFQIAEGAKLKLAPPRGEGGAPPLNLDGRWPLTSPEDVVAAPETDGE